MNVSDILRFFSAGLSNFDFAYRELLQRKSFFPKIGSLSLFQLWRNFPNFWQAFEIFKLWHPVAQGEQILLWETFFPKNCCRTLSEIRSSAWPKNNSVRFLKLHSIGRVEIIWNNFFSEVWQFFWQSCRSFILVVDKNSRGKTYSFEHNLKNLWTNNLAACSTSFFFSAKFLSSVVKLETFISE